MFIIAYLGFFRSLSAEQRALGSTGHGDAAAKCDLLVLLTRTFDLLIDRFPAGGLTLPPFAPQLYVVLSRKPLGLQVNYRD